ncbi:hypothetical protein MO973_44950 [Paenibacillus sp. TRM 82003]|uniref:hypothetical protein n=1 Tax=Kineococcus sp. TRM81007 TaxID=2925831 RepID=UPI001F568AD3|nr:hypothetical protein [Kineococcus sp. TRM81007]MCI2238683.1 hypothetical protein [Kineococcus sp. TRM81007]MCI3927345.1 hypothetical protein [Paenibacillus sp. TRM 82003]
MKWNYYEALNMPCPGGNGGVFTHINVKELTTARYDMAGKHLATVKTPVDIDLPFN